MVALTKTPAYGMRVLWSEEDQSFVALCPELQGISAFGASYEEAIRELGTAVELAVQALREDGEPLPVAGAEPSYSGQFRVRLPRSLHARLAEQAEREGISLNTLLVAKLSDTTSVDAVVRHLIGEVQTGSKSNQRQSRSPSFAAK